MDCVEATSKCTLDVIIVTFYNLMTKAIALFIDMCGLCYSTCHA